MEICLFTDSFLPRVGGMELVIHHIANAFSENNCKTTIIAKRAKSSIAAIDLPRSYDLVYYGFNFPLSWRLRADFISGLLALMREHKKHMFDVIHCHSVSYAGTIAAFAKQIINVPLVMTPHGKDIQRVPEIGYGLRLQKKWDRIIQKNLAAADAVTAISNTIKDDLSFLDHNKIHFVPNGIDTQRFHYQKSDFLYKHLSLDQTTKIILSVGRNHIKKGYQYGLKCLKKLYHTHPKNGCVYVIIGKGTKALEPLVRQLSLEGLVYLLPEMDRPSIQKSYQSAWCYFSPSIIEGLSLVGLEAMAAGLPLVVTDVPGNRDIVQDNECGIIVQNKNPQSMAKAIKYLYHNAALYRTFSERAVQSAKLYDWMRIAEMYLNVYHKAADKPRIVY